MVSIRRTGIPPDLPEVESLSQAASPSAPDNDDDDDENRSPSPPSLSPSPPVERPSTQPAGSVLQQIQENAFGPPPSSNRPANTATAPPADPRLTSMTPRDPRLAAAPVAATSNHVPTDLIENQTPPAGTGSLLFNELAQMAGSSYSPALSLAHLSSAPMGFVPALSIDPRLAASSQSYSIAPSVSALVESKSKQPAAPSNPLYFDYGEDDDDDTRLEEQRKLRKEHEERVAYKSSLNLLEQTSQASRSCSSSFSSTTTPKQTPEQLAAAIASFYGGESSADSTTSLASTGQPRSGTGEVDHRWYGMKPAPVGPTSGPPPAAAPYDPFTPSSFSGPPALVKFGPGQTTIPTTTCYLGGLPPGTTHEALRSHFSAYGKIVRLKVMEDKNVAFVTFAHRQDAQVLKGQGDAGQAFFGGNLLKVGWARGANPPGTKENFNMETGETLVTLEEAARYRQQNHHHQQQQQQQQHPPPSWSQGPVLWFSSGGRGRGRGGGQPQGFNSWSQPHLPLDPAASSGPGSSVGEEASVGWRGNGDGTAAGGGDPYTLTHRGQPEERRWRGEDFSNDPSSAPISAHKRFRQEDDERGPPRKHPHYQQYPPDQRLDPMTWGQDVRDPRPEDEARYNQQHTPQPHWPDPRSPSREGRGARGSGWDVRSS